MTRKTKLTTQTGLQLANDSSPLRPGIQLLTPSSPHAFPLLEAIVQLHACCILNDHTMATFIPPLSHAKMLSRWTTLLSETSQGRDGAAPARVILVCLSEVASRNRSPRPEDLDSFPPFGGATPLPWPSWLAAPPSTAAAAAPLAPQRLAVERHGLELAGVVSLSCPPSETGPFRGTVQNLFVSPFHRYRGIATALMTALEVEALRQSPPRWNLMLDTTMGTGAELVYPKLGWETLGVVNNYGLDPRDGKTLVDEIWFWKDIRGRMGAEDAA